MENKFTDEDCQKFNILMSKITTSAQFNLTFNEFIDFYNLVDHMKKVIYPKLQANVLEVMSVKQMNNKKSNK